jgi:hypothetical protein
MAWRGRVVCAGVSVVLLMGCVGGDGIHLTQLEEAWRNAGLQRWGTGRQSCIVAGSLTTVSLAVQEKLSDRGLFVRAVRDGKEMRIESSTGGKRFVLRLARLERGKGEETAVRLRWEGDADPDFWPALAEELTRSCPPPGPGFCAGAQ